MRKCSSQSAHVYQFGCFHVKLNMLCTYNVMYKVNLERSQKTGLKSSCKMLLSLVK